MPYPPEKKLVLVNFVVHPLHHLGLHLRDGYLHKHSNDCPTYMVHGCTVITIMPPRTLTWTARSNWTGRGVYENVDLRNVTQLI